MSAETLYLLPTLSRTQPPARAGEVSVCGGCQAHMRPAGTTEAQYPGTVPEWGDHQCRSCDYISAGRDPEDRFIPAERIVDLAAQRARFEAGRKLRDIPEDGLRIRSLRHLKVVK